jgi:hypothetical protein
MTNGSIGTAGGCRRAICAPMQGKSLRFGGSSCPDGATLSGV